MKTSFSIEGKKAIVTGAARGLGRFMVKGLHEAGVDLALIDVSDNIQSIAKEMGTQGARVVGVQADLSHRDALKRSFNEAVAALGGLDILVNNAGITRWSPADTMSEADWDIVLEVNLNSIFLLAQLAGQQMLKQGCG